MPAPADTSTLVLTVNTRLARWLSLQHNRRQAASQTVWQTPRIVPFETWLRQTWIESWPQQHVLSGLQSRKVWERIIRNDIHTSQLDLLHLQGAALQAAEAFGLIHQYQVDPNPNHYTLSEESHAFHRWQSQYRDQLKKWNALDPAQILSAVQDAMQAGRIDVPSTIQFAGFDEWTPQLQHFIQFSEDQGATISYYPEPSAAADADPRAWIREQTHSVRLYADPHEEVIQCARWVRSVMQPETTIGLIVTNMEDYRELLVHELKAELAPDSVYCWEGKEAPFNVSLGTSLAREHMVGLALNLLALPGPSMPAQLCSQLMISPYFGNWPAEKSARLQCDRALRRQRSVRVSVNHALNSTELASCEAFRTVLQKWKDWGNASGSKRPGQWAQQIAKMLHEMNWPRGERTLSSREFQVHDSWNECLDELATLDGVLGSIDRVTLVNTLTHIVQDKIFQPKTREEPIQVVGLLEAAGMQFDHVWVLGCHAENLPAPNDPNPFIPFTLQRQHQLPHCTPNRTLRFYETILARLLNAAPDIQLSAPKRLNDRELLVSPLLKSMEPMEPDATALPSHRLIDQYHDHTRLEDLEDRSYITVTAKELDFLSGGHSLLKHQAECPFRAFALHRLKAEALQGSDFEMDALERGKLVHRTLELFWKQVKTKSNLNALAANGTLAATVEAQVDAVLAEKPFLFFGQMEFKKLEWERLCDLTLEWLTVEQARDDFEVLGAETPIEYALGDLRLRLQIDRIDRTDDKQLVLIDYKTGNQFPATGWHDERILEPQLPLYCLAHPADAILFAKVNKGGCAFKGMGRDGLDFPGLNNKAPDKGGFNDWDHAVSLWRDRMQGLATQFLQGSVQVDPVPSPSPCDRCELSTLCRKAELLIAASTEDEGDDS
ncbi:PD-(D/E)XK nuclease family protein [Nitrospina watsonii]|uniref:DNA helicase/exodeoxyribonuclease V, subunit B n=1 Tax=Nitrospina watsonii TaxID=1323948 RepID=A0ABN8W337_9BACT|nr:PD-(D/E)XK nuclease family protein [Nitrospina watsonii]CAI2718453.1 Putative DNA helicase/exodeoxyribonuclease V, subunit B [Nitrospina watsonii]